MGKIKPEEKQLLTINFGILGVLILASTILHHFFPGVLSVPSHEGIPFYSFPSLFTQDLIPIGLSYLCFVHSIKYMGLWQASVFLSGSFVFTGLEESMWILAGRFSGIQETYYFSRAFLWFVETPVMACLGWYFIAYACVYISSLILKNRGLWTRAICGGLIAMDLDLWLDPVQTSPEWKSWFWLSPDKINIFSIPLSNFIGWFLLIFLFALVFEKLPVLEKRYGQAWATLRFYGILLLLEVGILIFFGIYGTFVMKYIPLTNLTLGGI
ncbi:MAG: carotenoid biosynthesis protein [Proteobacteria bacterium]|nr:carotenoid biosynthesis protein [Pseudomonadota bacterium]